MKKKFMVGCALLFMMAGALLFTSCPGPAEPPATAIPDVPSLSVGTVNVPIGALVLNWNLDASATMHEVRFGLREHNLPPVNSSPWTMAVTRTGTIIGEGGLLFDDTEYTVWVRAGNAFGWSEWTSIYARTIVAPPPPAAPVVFATAPGGVSERAPAISFNTHVMLYWEPMPDAIQFEIAWTTTPWDPEGAQTMTEFLAAIPAAARYIVNAPATQGPAFNLEPSTAANGIVHYVYVTAIGRARGGTTEVRVRPTIHGSLIGVPNIGIDARELGNLRIRWSNISGAVGWEFRYNTEFNFETSTLYTGNASNRDITFMGLTDNSLRFFWVRAVLPGGEFSPWAIANGRSRSAPTHPFQINNNYPAFTPNAANWARNEKRTIAVGQSFSSPAGVHGSDQPATTGGNSRILRNTVYMLTRENDPRVVLGLELGPPDPRALANNPELYALMHANTGRLWFDQVILFNAAIRCRDCLNDTESVDPARSGEFRPFNVNGRPDNHMCDRQGLHLHVDNALQYVLDNRDIYIAPLQEAGIRVLVSILGDWSGIAFNTFGEWPFEDVAPVRGPGHVGMIRGGPGAAPPPNWRDADGNPYYPYHNAARDTFLIEIKNFLNRYQLDGICLDDEWAHAGNAEYRVVTPQGTTTWMYSQNPPLWNYYSATAAHGIHQPARRQEAARGRLGKNMAHFIIALRETIGPNFIIHLYEFGGFGNGITGQHSGWSIPRTVPHPFTGEYVNFHDFFDMSTWPMWPGHNAIGALDTPPARFAATSIDLFQAGPTGRVRPAITASGDNTMVHRARQNLTGDWGWLTYYGLTSRYRYGGGRRDAPHGQLARIHGYNMSRFFDPNVAAGTGQGPGGLGLGPEAGLTILSEVLFGAPVVWNSGAYGVPYTAVHGPWRDRAHAPWYVRMLAPDID